MRISDNGFFPWLVWALFKWKGTINRLPFLGAAVCYVVLDVLYSLGILLLFAHVIIPLPDGAMIDGPYLHELLLSGKIPIYAFFSLIVVRILLQVKRLRSIGVTPWIAVIVNLAKEFNPGGEGIVSIIGLLMMCYYAILLFVPAKDTAMPVHGRGRWPVGGDGRPRKLDSSELSNWRVIEPAPRQEPGEETTGQDEEPDGKGRDREQ